MLEAIKSLIYILLASLGLNAITFDLGYSITTWQWYPIALGGIWLLTFYGLPLLVKSEAGGNN